MGRAGRAMQVFALAAALIAGGVPVASWAVGLGNIELQSRLNQQLKARIEVVGLKAGEAEDLKVSLGDDAAFERHGLTREAIHLALRFKFVATGETSGHIEVTTRQTMREPTLEFVVQLRGKSGQRQRSYSLVLSPT